MTKRLDRPGKSKPGDWDCIVDEEAANYDRVTSLSLLCFDGHARSLVPLAETWLVHPDSMLRHEGLKLLIFRLGSRTHLGHAFAALHNDSHWSVRSGAARLLVSPYIFAEDTRDEILRHLVAQLEADEDEDAQMGIYDALLRALIPNRADRPKLPGDARGWDRARDVDWRLLAPWRTPPP